MSTYPGMLLNLQRRDTTPKLVNVEFVKNVNAGTWHIAAYNGKSVSEPFEIKISILRKLNLGSWLG